MGDGGSGRDAHMGDVMDYNEGLASAVTKPTTHKKGTEKSRATKAKASKPKGKGAVGKELARDERVPKRDRRRRPLEIGRHRQVGLADY